MGAAISAVDGTFMLEPEQESYQFIVQHLLYQTRQVKDQARDAGIITLEPKDYNLEEVVIKGERSLVKVNAARKSKVDDNTARMQSIKQLGV